MDILARASLIPQFVQERSPNPDISVVVEEIMAHREDVQRKDIAEEEVDGDPAHLPDKVICLDDRDEQKAQSQKKNHGFKLDPQVQIAVENMLMKIRYVPRLGMEESCEKDDSIDARYRHIKNSQFKRKFIEVVSGNIQQNLSKALLMTSKLKKDDSIDKKLLDEHVARQNSSGYKSMRKFRRKLPAYKMRRTILDLVNSNQVIVISGETGCGKTTQVAQFILDDAIKRHQGSITKIACTQPKRISAISVAERVAVERGEDLGNSVGYHIRLEKILSRDYGSILFCTTGLLLQYMQGGPALQDFSHVILDEIHERNTESDFIIMLLKQIIPKRPDLKVILMSATMNSERFSAYYNNCPNIHIPGFTYPVKEYYLEDVLEITRFSFPMQFRGNIEEFNDEIKPAVLELEMEKKYSTHVTNELRNPNSERLSLKLIQELLQHICWRKGPGAILVFLPGIMEIMKLTQLLLESGQFPPHKCVIYPLHSRMPTVKQKCIFKVPPKGSRKIIIATSIAETSITIEDVVYVVDCGLAKLTNFDITKNIETLDVEWATLAIAKQRCGRAGRVQPGECYHLFSKIRGKMLEQYPLPEMLRTPLEQVILQAKILQLGKAEIFLSGVMDPPEPKAIELSLDRLRNLNTLDANENLTPLGYHLAKLPLDPRTGKMIIWASLFSCVDPVLSIAASLTFKDAFHCPFDKETQAKEQKRKLSLGHFSDHIVLAEALKRYESCISHEQADRFCSKNFLFWNTLQLLSDMKHEFARHLCEMKFLNSRNPSKRCANRNSDNLSMIKAIVCAGLYPNVATITNKKRSPRISTGVEKSVKIHPSSVNAGVSSFPTQYLTYFLKRRSSEIFLFDSTCISWTALLFAAPKCTIESHAEYSNIVLNDSLIVRCEAKTAGLIQRVRQQVETLLEYKITHPGTVEWDSPEGQLLKAVREIVSQGYPEMTSGMHRSRRSRPKKIVQRVIANRSFFK